MTHMTRFVLSVAMGALLLAACAEERPPIDRVQPFALDKAYFVGADFVDVADDPEFWFQSTLIDVGYGASQDGLFTSTYAQPMSRLRWEITEDHLIGRAAYERIEGSDGKGVGGPIQDGVIVAVFDITSHFDVVNAYNSTTGEKLNIIEENSHDRPWYERQYMRVDWSKNLNTDSYDFDTLSLVGIYGGVEYEPLAYYVDDPLHPDAPVFDLENGYFDVTTKAFAKPGVVDLSHLGWGIDSFPSCYLDNDFFGGSAPAGTCSPVELTLRMSFRKVVDSDYEPIEWDGFRFQAFGGFTVDRYGFARNYGMSDALWHRFLTRYNLWEQSHSYTDFAARAGAVACNTPATTPFGADPLRDDNGNGTHDECESVGNGSRCDPFEQKCTLPFRQRVPKPIVWYYTSGSNPDYFDATAIAAHNWDVALRTAIRTAQYGECVNTGGTDCQTKHPMYFGQQTDNQDAIDLAMEVDDCRSGRTHAELNKDAQACAALAGQIGQARGYSAGVVSIAQMPEMVVLCHSPVEAGDNALCGGPRLPEGLTARACADAYEANDRETMAVCNEARTARRGDLRFHQINGIREPQTPSPWGIYTDAEDPLNGETISTSVNVWTYVNDLWSQGIIDKLRYIRGELQTEEVTEGKDIERWAEAAEAASGNGMLPKLHREEAEHLLSQFTRAHREHDVHSEHVAPLDLAAGAPEALQQARKRRDDLQGVLATEDRTSSQSPIYAARASSARGTQVEAELMTRSMRELYGIESMPSSDGMLDLMSPLRGGNPSVVREIRRMKEHALHERGACVLYEYNTPMTLTALAGVLEAKFGAFNPADPLPIQQARAEKMRAYVAQRAHMSVIVHEMGHSVGLRHNVVSSSDAWNFRPQYWQLRTKNGQVTQTCDTLSDGEACVGPRYFDPVTKNEQDNLIEMFMHFSVMEYAGEPTQDFLGIGAWDFAAMHMMYGDVVAVYSDPSYAFGTERATTALAKMDNFGGILGITHQFGGDDIHYSELQTHFDLIRDCKVVDPNVYKPARWDASTHGVWHPVLDGLLVQVDGQYSRCRQQPVDYVRWDSLSYPLGFSGYFRGDRAIDQQGRLRVPYGFATDRWADLGNLSVYRHDNGADAYEIFNFLITSQEVNHIFDNYRRGRHGFSVRSASGRTLSRYNEKVRDGAKGLSLMRNVYEDFSLAQGYNFDQFWPSIAPLFFADNILASSMVFDHFTRTLTRPQAGAHFQVPGETALISVDDYVGNAGATRVTVPNGATGRFGNVIPGGRPIENRLAETMGEYDSEYTVNCGSYYDKVYAPFLFTESVDNFISDSRGDFTDARYRATSLADLFPEGYRRLLANMLTGDTFLKGPRVEADAAGNPLLTAEGYPLYGIGWTTWWGDEPRVCFPADGSPICTSFGTDDAVFGGHEAVNTVVLDPQVDWEQQKFLIAMTLLYLPENQKQNWINMMRIWELGVDADPGFANRIEFHDPSGKVYVAKTFGKEVIFGKTVQKGIAARVLEYANELLQAAYVVDDGPDLDADGTPDWYIPTMNPSTGQPAVKFDPTIAGIEDGYVKPGESTKRGRVRLFSGAGGAALAARVSEWLDTHPEVLKAFGADADVLAVLERYPEQIRPFVERYSANHSLAATAEPAAGEAPDQTAAPAEPDADSLSTIAELESRLAAARAEIEQLQTVNDGLAAQIAAAGAERDALANDKNGLAEQLAAVQQKLAEALSGQPPASSADAETSKPADFWTNVRKGGKKTA